MVFDWFWLDSYMRRLPTVHGYQLYTPYNVLNFVSNISENAFQSFLRDQRFATSVFCVNIVCFVRKLPSTLYGRSFLSRPSRDQVSKRGSLFTTASMPSTCVLWLFNVVLPRIPCPIVAATNDARPVCSPVTQNLMRPTGTIMSPYFPGDYVNNTLCQWRIISSNGVSIVSGRNELASTRVVSHNLNCQIVRMSDVRCKKVERTETHANKTPRSTTRKACAINIAVWTLLKHCLSDFIVKIAFDRLCSKIFRDSWSRRLRTVLRCNFKRLGLVEMWAVSVSSRTPDIKCIGFVSVSDVNVSFTRHPKNIFHIIFFDT